MEFLVADCADREAYAGPLARSDIVYHCAAAPYEGVSVFSPYFVHQHTAAATVAILSAAANTGRRPYCLCMTELFDALRSGDKAAVRRLLATSPQLARERTDDGISAVLWAVYVGEPVLAEHVARAAGTLDVFEATALGKTGQLASLLAADSQAATAFSPDGFTALHLAAFFGQPAAAAMLISAGAELDVRSTNTMRLTPLQSATAGRRPQVVRLLLVNGADPTLPQEGGFTPLHSAARGGDIESATLLLDYGADPDQPADDGRTAAHMATGAVVKLLRDVTCDE